MNKKAQYGPAPSYTSVHPLFIIGIVLFILPYLAPVFRWTIGAFLDNIFFYLGLTFIIWVGALSIMKTMR